MSPARKPKPSKKATKAARPARPKAKATKAKAPAAKAAKPKAPAKAARRACHATDPFGDACQSVPRPGSKYCTIHSYLER